MMKNVPLYVGRKDFSSFLVIFLLLRFPHFPKHLEKMLNLKCQASYLDINFLLQWSDYLVES